ncbi:MAG: hypothetical protein V2A77_03310 [Pseudomonadota bacterium]
MSRFPPLDLSRIRPTSLAGRQSKVGFQHLGRPFTAGGSFGSFLDTLPDILAAAELKDLASRWAEALRHQRTIILAMGAHPIKVGLSPVIIDLMERGAISLLALNGAGVIHDSELALAGHTSEDVAAVLGSGNFGMSEDTQLFLNAALRRAAAEEMGMGEAVGRALLEAAPHRQLSLLASAARMSIPVTVHVAIGTDTVHIHPQADGAAIGQASLRDFRTFASAVATLEGGVYINLGSAVLLPEVFLKALTLARNIGHKVNDFTAVNMDFMSHYRPLTNVVRRPTANGGKGINLIGHHEIMLPLLAAAVKELSGRE